MRASRTTPYEPTPTVWGPLGRRAHRSHTGVVARAPGMQDQLSWRHCSCFFIYSRGSLRLNVGLASAGISGGRCPSVARSKSPSHRPNATVVQGPTNQEHMEEKVNIHYFPTLDCCRSNRSCGQAGPCRALAPRQRAGLAHPFRKPVERAGALLERRIAAGTVGQLALFGEHCLPRLVPHAYPAASIVRASSATTLGRCRGLVCAPSHRAQANDQGWGGSGPREHNGALNQILL